MTDPADIHRLAAELGFALCGICDARISDHVEDFRRWIAEGRHGEMEWLTDHVAQRMDPCQLLPGARSIIVVADVIPVPQSPLANPPSRIARYATVPDYHVTIKKRLHKLADVLRAAHPAEQFRGCVDTAPMLEREHAVRAGLGWVGKNTLLLNGRLGSHLLLGEIVTTWHLPPDEPASGSCGSCTRCIDACPTDAITPYSVDATRCISYLTIEHRSLIDKRFHEAIGDWIYGCDICQEVCPFVQRAERACKPEIGHQTSDMSPLAILHWTESDRRTAFTRSAMKRVKLHQFKRNALIVAGNHLRKQDDPALRLCIERIADDENEHPLVRDTARQVIGM